MKVWVVYADMGYDGYSCPLKAFSTREAAVAYCDDDKNDYNSKEGMNDEYCPFDWEELEVNWVILR